MNCQRTVNSILPTQLPHKFPYIVAILIHNHFESPNTGLFTVEFPREFNVMQHNILKAQIARYHV
jgi:hypothetical protein